MVHLQEAYSLDAVHMADEKLRIIGLDPEKDISPRTTTTEVKVWTTILNSNSDLEKIGVKKNDQLLLFQSLRYTKEALISELEKTGRPYSIFDTGCTFIATLLRTKPS
jgi:hypothetical protein